MRRDGSSARIGPHLLSLFLVLCTLALSRCSDPEGKVASVGIWQVLSSKSSNHSSLVEPLEFGSKRLQLDSTSTVVTAYIQTATKKHTRAFYFQKMKNLLEQNRHAMVIFVDQESLPAIAKMRASFPQTTVLVTINIWDIPPVSCEGIEKFQR